MQANGSTGGTFSFTIAPCSPDYLKSVRGALDAGDVVLDTEWHIERTRVRVPAMQKTAGGLEATTVRNSKLYSRSGSQHDTLERGLVALALEENSIPDVTVLSTRMLNSEGSKGFITPSSSRSKSLVMPRERSSGRGWPS